MAINYDRDNNSFTHIGVPFNYNRGNPLPLDNTSVWTSKEAAENYAKTSPVAYVGQMLTVVDKENQTASTFIISSSEGALTQIDADAYAYTRLSKVKDFLYSADYTKLDYNKAANYFKSNAPVLPNGVVVSKGGVLGCECSAPYDNTVEFVVNVEAVPMRHGSTAICGGLDKLTAALLAKDGYHPLFSILPFSVSDGINDAGVAVAIRQVPADKGNTTGTRSADDSAISMSAYMLPRYVLDNFDTAKSAVTHISNKLNVSCVEGKEVHLMVADAAETYLVEFVNNETVVTKMTSCPYMSDFHLDGVVLDGGKVTYSVECNVEPHGRGLERFNVIADAFEGIDNALDCGAALNNLRYSRLYTDASWYSELCGGDLTVDKIVSELERFENVLAAEREAYAVRTRETGDTGQSAHIAVYDLALRRIVLLTQECPATESLIFGEDGKKRSGVYNAAVSFVAVWDINSTAVGINGFRLTPKVVNDVYGWNRGDTSRLYYTNGKWNLITPAGVASVEGPYNEYELVFKDFPFAGDTTVLFRHESNDNADRLVTASELSNQDAARIAEIEELFRRLGDGFFCLTSHSVFLEGTDYYLKQGNGFVLATAGVDYTVGDSVPEDTFYEIYTNANISERVLALEKNKADKATTLAGYGITDAKITGETDKEQLTVGDKTIDVATRSYVDSSVKTEANRAKEAERVISERLASRVTAYVTDSTMILTTGEAPAS